MTDKIMHEDTTVTPYVFLKASDTDTKTFIKKADSSVTSGYDIIVSSYNTPTTSKLRTLHMSEMEIEYNIRQQKLTSITFKDTTVHKEIKLLVDGTGILTVIDGMDTVGENDQLRKRSKETIESISLNDGVLYTTPFNLVDIYEDLTGEVMITEEEEDDKSYWWSEYSLEETQEALGLTMEKSKFKNMMLKMHQFFESEEAAKEEPTEQLVVKALDVELKETIEVVYMPDIKDLHGQFMTKEEIIKGEANFSDNLKAGLVKGNLFHHISTDKFTIEDSWVTKMDGTYGEDETFLAEGTWLAKCKFHDDVLWEMKKSNELGGLSFGGRAFVDEETGEISDLTFDPVSTDAIFDLTEES